MISADIAIRVRGLSKSYVLSHEGTQYATLIQTVLDRIRRPFAKPKGETFWALRDLEFEIRRGDVVGIIGRNGAGKSTILKILSRITEPTEGQVELYGRVGSLLEVGTGFHPELTGRENVYLNGAILGMRKAEITRRFDEIVEFAGVSRFLDTPVKRYSSGMYVRLAFAVAAHLESEILIIDEVLAVGDAEFQKKCLGKMRDAAESGRTVLFVSHNLAAVSQLTQSSILLSSGRIQFFGPTQDAVRLYTEASAAGATVHFDVEAKRRQYPGNQAARIQVLAFPRGLPVFAPEEDVVFTARILAMEDIPRLRFSLTVFASDGAPVGSCFGLEQTGPMRGESTQFEIRLPAPRLAPGRYHCGVAIGKGDHRTGHVDYDVVLDTLQFEVRPEEADGGVISSWNQGWGNVVFLPLNQRRIVEGPSNG